MEKKERGGGGGEGDVERRREDRQKNQTHGMKGATQLPMYSSTSPPVHYLPPLQVPA